jgi:hypothetical protein
LEAGTSRVAPGEIRFRWPPQGSAIRNVLIVQGKYQTKPQTPFLPGCEVA